MHERAAGHQLSDSVATTAPTTPRTVSQSLVYRGLLWECVLVVHHRAAVSRGINDSSRPNTGSIDGLAVVDNLTLEQLGGEMRGCALSRCRVQLGQLENFHSSCRVSRLLVMAGCSCRFLFLGSQQREQARAIASLAAKLACGRTHSNLEVTEFLSTPSSVEHCNKVLFLSQIQWGAPYRPPAYICILHAMDAPAAVLGEAETGAAGRSEKQFMRPVEGVGQTGHASTEKTGIVLVFGRPRSTDYGTSTYGNN